MGRHMWAASVLWAALSSAVWGQTPAGGEFVVTSFTTHSQALPSVAMDASGNFVVAWQTVGRDESGYAIVRTRITAAGVVKDAPIRINQYGTADQRRPAVAADAVGNFVIAWESGQQDGSGYGIFRKSFSHQGIEILGPFVPESLVNTYTTGNQSYPAVAMNPQGRFAIVWEGDQGDGSGPGVFGRLFDATRVPLGPEFQVNVYATGDQGRPAVAMDVAGNSRMVWHSQGEDGSARGIAMRRFDPEGVPGASSLVNTIVSGDQAYPAVSMNASGAFVVAWQSDGIDGSESAIVARLFDSFEAPLGPEFQVNIYTTGAQLRPRVSMDTAGNFVVAWASEAQDGSSDGLFARRYDPSGTPQAGEFQVNTYTTGSQFPPLLAGNADGDFVSIWQSGREDGTQAIAGQRYGDAIFQDGFETRDLSRWSGSAGLNVPSDVIPLAGLASTTTGLEVSPQGATYVQDDQPAAENRYRARFYFDPHTLDPGESEGHFRVRLFLALGAAPNQRQVAVVLRREGGAYSLMGRARRDDGTRSDTGFFSISNAPHVVEIDWRRSSAPGANDGQLVMWIDETLVSTLTGLDNDSVPVERARMGLISAKSGASGSVYFDQFESRRQRYIGPE